MIDTKSFIIVGNSPSTKRHVHQQNGYNVNCFLDEFAEFLSKSTVAKSEIIILGDVNIHLDVKTNTHTRRFIELLESNGFKQHVHEPKHYLAHTLDVLITRDTSDIVANVTVTDIGLCTLMTSLTITVV